MSNAPASLPSASGATSPFSQFPTDLEFDESEFDPSRLPSFSSTPPWPTDRFALPDPDTTLQPEDVQRQSILDPEAHQPVRDSLEQDLRVIERLEQSLPQLAAISNRIVSATMSRYEPPVRGDRRAPQFDGSEPLELERFFEDVDFIASQATWDATVTIRRGYKYYAKADVSDLWDTIDVKDDVNKFKTEVRALYPSLKKGQRFAKAEVFKFIETWAEKEIKNRDSLAEYNRESLKRLSYLKKSGEIDDRVARDWYLAGVHKTLRDEIIKRQEAQGNEHPYPSSDVYAEALKILTKESPVLWDRIDRGASSGVPPGGSISVKQEETDLSKVLDTLKSFQIQIDTLSRSAAPRSAFTRAPMASPRPIGCNFCSDPHHFIRACPKVLEYLQAGKCARGHDGRITLPNGSYVPNSTPGRNLMERIDNCRASNTSANVHAVNIIEEAQTASDTADTAMAFMHETADDTDNELGLEIERMEILLGEVKKKANAGRRMKFDGVEIPVKVGPPGRAAQRAPLSRTNDPKPAPRPKPLPPNNDITKKTSPQPQYKYVVPIEDSQDAANVLSRTLDSNITITQRELLSIAPDVRKQLKELTTAKRQNMADVNLVEYESSVSDTGGYEEDTSDAALVALGTSAMTAEATLPLRTVNALVEDTLEVECVLDQGAVVCLMREDLWEKLRVPLSPDKNMTLETANTAKSATLGLIPNTKFTIAAIDVMLQVQVVRQAPFQVLLGRPFFAVTECETKDFVSGDQHITLTDPHDKSRQCKVATGIRNVTREIATQGFRETSRN